MNHYRITVNGKSYEVDVEELDGAPSVSDIRPIQAQASASVPAAPVKPESAPVPALAVKPKAATAAPGGAQEITSPMPGTVISVSVKEGQQVSKGQVLVVFEAMKMENEIVAPRDAVVTKVYVEKGSVLDTGTAVITLDQ